MKKQVKTSYDEPWYSQRAQEIIDQAVDSGAGELHLDMLCEGRAEMQAEQEQTARIIQWVQSKTQQN